MGAAKRLEDDTSYELPIAGKKSFRTTCPAFVDAFEVFSTRGWPVRSGRVLARSMELPSGAVVSFVGIQGDHPDRPYVALAPCSGIRAADTAGVRTVYPPELFDNASIDEDGNVELADGRFLHACEVIPATLPIKWDDREHRILNLAIGYLGAANECFVEINWDAFPNVGEVAYVPASTENRPAFIDYAAVRKQRMEAKNFKGFMRFYEDRTPEPDRLSRQTIARILQNAGMRLPRSGPKARNHAEA